MCSTVERDSAGEAVLVRQGVALELTEWTDTRTHEIPSTDDDDGGGGDGGGVAQYHNTVQKFLEERKQDERVTMFIFRTYEGQQASDQLANILTSSGYLCSLVVCLTYEQ